MALTLLRFFDVKTPLLPITDKHAQKLTQLQTQPTTKAAVADLMPASTDDYILLYTETGELTLRPVAISIASHIR